VSVVAVDPPGEPVEDFDLVIVGTGSGNAIPADLDDARIALVERDVFSGTCINRGCVPSKMFVYAADIAMAVREAGRYGLDAQLNGADWPAIRDRVFGRIDPIVAQGEEYRAERCPNTTYVHGTGRFVDTKVLEVNGRRLTAERFLLAAGARPFIPDIPGLDGSGFHTSDTIMRIDTLPRRLVVLGGGYIAIELGHVFDGLGSEVSIVNRGPRLLRSEDDDVSVCVTDLAAERFNLHLGARVDRVERANDEVTVVYHQGDGPEHHVRGDMLLVATGRVPNCDLLDLDATGVRTDPSGAIVVDEHQETSMPGIYAIGDIANHRQLKHVANAEARVAFHNIAHPDEPRVMDHSIIPHAVFGHPQVASVGLTERQAAAETLPFVCGSKMYSSTAYGWAMEDTTSFVKLIAHAHTRRLLGAHIVGPQASTLIQVLIQGMRFGSTVDELAREQMWIHPALTEVIENALLEL